MEQVCDISISLPSIAVQSLPFDAFLLYKLSSRNSKQKQTGLVSNGMPLMWTNLEKMNICCNLKELWKHFISIRIIQVTPQRMNLNMGEIKVQLRNYSFLMFLKFFVTLTFFINYL